MKQTKRITTLLLCGASLLSSLFSISSSLAQAPMPQGPGAAGMQMPQGAFPPGFSMANMPAPNEAELEEALKFIQYLEENDPEQLKMLEQMGQQMINQMSDDDLGQLSEMFNIAPDELRAEARKGLEGFAPPIIPGDVERPAAPAQPVAPTPAARKQAGEIVNNLIDVLASLRQKGSSVREVNQMIRSWRQELRDLMFYLNIIDEKKQHLRLAQPDSKSLYQSLNSLYATLKIEEPRIILPDDLVIEDNAYSLLGVKTGAAAKKVDKAFNRLEKEYNTEALTAQFTAQGLTDKDLKRQIKAKKLAFEVIEDAYEQLSDPKLRKQIDREIEAQNKKSKQDIETASAAITNITAALGQAIYTEELLDQLERFLQVNAPEELKQKKAMDAAEKKRTEEQKRLKQITPSRTSGTFEPRIDFPRGNYANDYGYYDNFSPYSYDDYQDYPNYSYNDQQETPSKADSSKSSPDKTKGDKSVSTSSSAVNSKQETAAKKVDARTIETIIKDINTNLDHFETELSKPTNKKNIGTLDSYMHQATRTIKQADPEEIEGATIRNLFGEEEPGDKELLQGKNVPSALMKDVQVKDITDTGKTSQLEKLYQTTKLKELGEDMLKLDQILRIKKDTKRTTEESEAWNTLEERVETYQPNFSLLTTSLNNSMQGAVMPEKKDAHGKIIGDILESINKFSKHYETTKKKF